MAKTRQQKEVDLQELQEVLKNNSSVVFATYRGTSSKDMDSLRKGLTAKGVWAKVYKLPLWDKALKALGIDGTLSQVKLPLIAAFSSEEITTPAKIIKEFSKENKNLELVSGISESKILSGTEVKIFADLPSKQELRGSLVGTIYAPVSAFARVIDAIAKKKSEAQ